MPVDKVMLYTFTELHFEIPKIPQPFKPFHAKRRRIFWSEFDKKWQAIHVLIYTRFRYSLMWTLGDIETWTWISLERTLQTIRKILYKGVNLRYIVPFWGYTCLSRWCKELYSSDSSPESLTQEVEKNYNVEPMVRMKDQYTWSIMCSFDNGLLINRFTSHSVHHRPKGAL